MHEPAHPANTPASPEPRNGDRVMVSPTQHGGGDTRQPELRIQPIRDGFTTPAYHSDLAAGLDLAACIDAPFELPPGERTLIPCGFRMSIPPGYEAQVRPRSGLAVKHGISMPNAPGTIDADYRGEVMVPLINLGADAVTIEPGMRIAQMVIAPVARAQVAIVDELDVTSRGADGFGSTGR
jgi:dUTP pyrophosphatase